MKTANDEVQRYAQMGMAALLPGMQHMLDLMQRQLDAMRLELSAAQEPQKKLRRPLKAAEAPAPAPARNPSGWPADPDERKKEMARRMQARDAKRRQRAQAHPKSIAAKDHPQHEKFVKIMRQASKRSWDNLTPKQRKARLAKMAAGRKAKQAAPIPMIKMATAS